MFHFSFRYCLLYQIVLLYYYVGFNKHQQNSSSATCYQYTEVEVTCSF